MDVIRGVAKRGASTSTCGERAVPTIAASSERVDRRLLSQQIGELKAEIKAKEAELEETMRSLSAETPKRNGKEMCFPQSGWGNRNSTSRGVSNSR